MLKAMEPTDAAINIVKFNTSVIFCFRTLYLWSGTRRVPAQAAPKTVWTRPRIALSDCRRKPAAQVCFLLTNGIPSRLYSG
jgi:hypothetical protein